MKSLFLSFVYACMDAIFVAFSYLLSLWLRFDGAIPTDLLQEAMYTLPLIISALLIFSIAFGCYESIVSYAGFSEMTRQLCAIAATTCFLLGIKSLGIIQMNYSVLIINAIFLFTLTAGIRLYMRAFRWICSSTFLARRYAKRVLLVGAGDAGAMTIKRWRSDIRSGKYPVAAIDDDPEKLGKRICGVRVCGGISKISEVANKYKADSILIAIPSADISTLKRLYNASVVTGLPVKLFQNAVSMQEILSNSKDELVEVQIDDLLNRERNLVDLTNVKSFIINKQIMVTGGAGSIGSELCRQLLTMGCKELVIYDINENAMFALNEEFKRKFSERRYKLVIGSVRDTNRLEYTFKKYKPQVVFHAAAHKHVPMMEGNPSEAVKNNYFGTRNVIKLCQKYGAAKFMLISTDKAVNPTNVMGATKRLCELMVQTETTQATAMAAVRFGNVLGSNGSVIPTFKRQIEEGGPVTVTDPDICRYFMTIPEAASLVLSASVMARGGEIYVLDMGEPVKIYDLACNLIRSSGLEPNKDIDIVFTGLRPGEKLYEELSLDSENIEYTDNRKIMLLRPEHVNEVLLKEKLLELERTINKQENEGAVRDALFNAIATGNALNPEISDHEIERAGAGT